MTEHNTTLRDQIYDVLERYPQTRNSDKILQAILWYEYYRECLVPEETKVDLFNGTTQYRAPVMFTEINGEVKVSEAFMDLPLGETVKRHRADIQNKQGELLPTSLQVAKARRLKEEDIREYYGDRGVTY